MALQVWLPLNGNLNNQGLSNLKFSVVANSTTISSDGKIGSCYNNNSFSDGGLISDATINLTQTQSMFCWFKFTSLYSGSSLGGGLVSQHRYAANRGMGITLKYVSSTTGYISVNTGNGSSRTYNTYIGTTLLQANTWYHGGYTYDGSIIKLYVNGNLELEQPYTGMSVPADYLSIFCWSLSGTNEVHNNYKLNGSLNDVRIYDHCLSPKEIKEISKGIVLHYKLDNEYIESTTNLCSNTRGGWNNSGTCVRDYDSSTISNRPTPEYVYSTTATSDGSMAITFGTTSNLPSKTIIASTYCWLDGPQDSQVVYLRSTKTDSSVGSLYYNGDANPNNWPKRQWIRISSSAIATASDATTFYLCTYITKNNEIRAFNGWQIEEKNHITAWVSPGTTVYDSSGYQNNGTIYNVLSVSTNTPRYNYCTQVLETGRIVYPFPKLQEFTYSFWFKRNRTSYSNREMLMTGWYGVSFELNPNNTLTLRHYLNSTGTWDVITTKVFNSTSEWYFITFTRNSSGISSIYVNGALEKTGTNTNTINYTATSAEIYTYSGISYQFRGSISDFRIYATALSDDDIKDLYNTSAYICNNGTLCGYEFEEEFNTNILSNYSDISLISMSGWGGSKEYDSNGYYLVLTATNGWRSFGWDTSQYSGQTICVDFDYRFTDLANYNSGRGVSCSVSSTVKYNIGTALNASSVNVWRHFRNEYAADNFFMIFLGGTDETGKSIVMNIKNLSILLKPSTHPSINKNGIIKSSMFKDGMTDTTISIESFNANSLIEI